MLMPMVWTNDVDEMMDDFFDPYDPFEVVPVVDVEPSKDEIEAAKSVERHARKEGRRYARALRSSWNEMNRDLQKLAMKTDVVDNGDHFTITADLPRRMQTRRRRRPESTFAESGARPPMRDPLKSAGK